MLPQLVLMLDVHLESQDFIWCYAFCKKNMWVQETRGGSRRDLLYHHSCELLRSLGFQASQPRVFRVFTPQSIYFHWSILLQLPLGHSGYLVCKDQQARGRVIILAKSDPLGCFSVLSCPVVTINGQIQLPWAKQGQWSGDWISRQTTELRGGASWGQRNLAWLMRKETVSARCGPQRAAAARAVILPMNTPLLSFHQES